MKFSIAEEIKRGASDAGVQVCEVSPEDATYIRDVLRRRFAKEQRFEVNCNNLVDYSALHHQDAWSWIGGLLGEGPVLLFYDSSVDSDRAPDRSIFKVPSGSDVVKILAECYGFVFYVTNEACDYIVTQNSHDVLMGAGKAKEAISLLASRMEPPTSK